MKYQRVKISGVIECQSEMCIASGQVRKNDNEQTYTDICLDADGKPYIPASSLRGLLRDLCKDNFPDLIKKLFGEEKNKNQTEEAVVQTGFLRFYDAMWCECGNLVYKKEQVHTHNSINPITGAAQDKHLYSHAYVPIGSRFKCEIEADNISQQQLQDLLSLLNCLDNNNPLSQLGKHQSKQQGLIYWQTKQVEVLEQDKLIKWLLDETLNMPLPFDAFDNKTKEVHSMTGSPLRTASHTPLLSCFVCTFIPQSPILINDPNLVVDKSEEPDFEFYRKGSQLIIPSSSLIGVLRGQCRKILLTLLMANPNAELKTAEEDAKKILDGLFGCTGQRSRVWLTDAIATNTAHHLQMFTAIDRFTGSVKDGALYTANAATATEIKTTLYLDQKQQALEAWQKGLLILVLRDAMEGDLKVGWGKSKGYGVLQLSCLKYKENDVNNWSDFVRQKYDRLERSKEFYLNALLTKLGV